MRMDQLERPVGNQSNVTNQHFEVSS
jgi:hypothetical protein